MADHLLTESGDRITTESGDFIILSLGYVPAGYIFVSNERAYVVTATGEVAMLLTASVTNEMALVPTAAGETAVTGSGG